MLSLLIEWWSQLVTGDSPWRQVTHHKETSLQKGTVAVHKLPCKEMCRFFRNSDDISTEILLIAFLTQAQTENSTFHIVTRHYFKRNCLYRYRIGRDHESPWDSMSHPLWQWMAIATLEGLRGQEEKWDLLETATAVMWERRLLLSMWPWGEEHRPSVQQRWESKIPWHLFFFHPIISY